MKYEALGRCFETNILGWYQGSNPVWLVCSFWSKCNHISHFVTLPPPTPSESIAIRLHLSQFTYCRLLFKLICSYILFIRTIINFWNSNVLLVLQCSVSCGKGTRSRQVYCQTTRGHSRAKSDCSHLIEPQSSEQCVEKPCGVWRSGDWGEVC